MSKETTLSKIVHLCMCGPVTDGWSYQDNLLTKYHRKLGYEVTIITSQWIWGNDGKLAVDESAEYVNEHDVKVIRLPIKNPKHNIESKFKRYENFEQTLKEVKPDILFIHGCQFLDLKYVRKYVKEHSAVKVYIDNHADFSNSGTNFLSKNVLHKGVWKHGAQRILPYVEKFYGVLPARVDFLVDMYQIPRDKTELLVMGADDELVKQNEAEEVKLSVRKKLSLAEDDFVVITGGKIDYAKRQTLLLMKAIQQINNPKVKLIVFGSVEDDIKREFDELCQQDDRIRYIGWIKADDSYQYFAASDLAVFPGRHSVMWEQVAGQGIPMVCKYWDGTTHVDVGGNTKFLYDDTVEEIKKMIEKLINTEDYREMKEIAETKGKEVFSYELISRRCIQ